MEYFVHLAVGVSFSSIPEALHCLLKRGSLCFSCGAAHMMSPALSERYCDASICVQDTKRLIAYLDAIKMNIKV